MPGSGPIDSTQGATQPHRADSSSWVAGPVIDVLSTAQQLSWFRVNCARNYPAQKGWDSPDARQLSQARLQVCGHQSHRGSGRAMLGKSSALGSPSQQGTAQLPSEATWLHVRGHSAAEDTKATWRDAVRDERCYKQPGGSRELSGLQACPDRCSTYSGREQETPRLNSSWSQPKSCSTHEGVHGTAEE